MPMKRNGAASSSASSNHRGMLLVATLFAIGEFILAVICAVQQIATTHDSIFGLLQGGVMVPTHMTAVQLYQFYQGTMDKDNRIAYLIAYVTQGVFLGTFIPGSPLHAPLLRRIVTIVFFALEVTSDLWYSVATGTTLTGAFSWVFSFAGGGWLVSLMYIVAMSAGSTLLLVDAIGRLEHIARALFASSSTAA